MNETYLCSSVIAKVDLLWQLLKRNNHSHALYIRSRGLTPIILSPFPSVTRAAQNSNILDSANLGSLPLTLNTLFAWLIAWLSWNKYCTMVHGSRLWYAEWTTSGYCEMIYASSNDSGSRRREKSQEGLIGTPDFLSMLNYFWEECR
jgi:hypothetical protein